MPNMPRPSHPKPNYGIDAPGVLITLAIFGLSALASAATLTASSTPNRWLKLLEGFALAYSAIFLGLALYMLYWSKIEKVRTRDSLLDLIPWTGNETVLDVGYGRGL